MSGLSIEERVAAGAEWLDANASGWVAQIDLSSLDIAEPCGCILGQVYGHYFRSPRSARHAGGYEEFDYLSDDRGFNGDEDEMTALTLAWADLILARREASR